MIASIVKNTSMTVSDIGELSFAELEELMDGMMKYSEREKRAIEKGTVEYKTADDLVAGLQAGTINL